LALNRYVPVDCGALPADQLDRSFFIKRHGEITVIHAAPAAQQQALHRRRAKRITEEIGNGTKYGWCFLFIPRDPDVNVLLQTCESGGRIYLHAQDTSSMRGFEYSHSLARREFQRARTFRYRVGSICPEVVKCFALLSPKGCNFVQCFFFG